MSTIISIYRKGKINESNRGKNNNFIFLISIIFFGTVEHRKI